MKKLPITVNSKTLFMDEEQWRAEQKWRHQKEREFHKNAVEFLNKVHNEAISF